MKARQAKEDARLALKPGMCCICMDMTSSVGLHKSVDDPLGCGHHFGRSCLLDWVSDKPGVPGHTQCPMKDCTAPCGPQSVPPNEIPPEPDELVLLLRPLRTDRIEEVVCCKETLVMEVKETIVERHREDPSLFDQPQVQQEVTSRNIRIAHGSTELMNTERVFSYGFHDFEQCPKLDMWLCLFEKQP